MSLEFALRAAVLVVCSWLTWAHATTLGPVGPGAPSLVAANDAAAAPAPAKTDRSDGKRQVWDLVLKKGRRVSEPAVLQVHQGDDVTLRVTSDAPDELHLHGYNLLLQVTPDATATLHFIAKLTGRFPVESHKTEASLGVIEVYPQ